MLEIIKHPAPVLSSVALPVEIFDQSLSETIKDLAQAMYQGKGVGLAAPQVGLLKRIIVLDPAAEGYGLLSMINPIIESMSPERIVGNESCLSLPGITVAVPRSPLINVKYNDESGEIKSKMLVGLTACIVQHEIDHLDGIVILQRALRTSRKRVGKR